MNPRSRKSGLSTSSVAHLRTLGTRCCPAVGRLMKSLTVAVRRASWTCARTRVKPTLSSHVAQLMESGQTDLDGFFQERQQKVLEQLVRVLDPIGVLSEDPNHSSLGIGCVQRVQVLAQRANDALVLVRIPPENVFNDDDSLLHDVADFGFDEREQSRDAKIRRCSNLDGDPADGPHSLAHEFHVNLGGVSGTVVSHRIQSQT